jgi:hypothetical protein
VGGVVIQRVENYLIDCVRSGSRALRTLALLALTGAGLLALAVGALVGFMQIAGLFMLAAWMGTESLTLPAVVSSSACWSSSRTRSGGGGEGGEAPR